MIVLLFEDGWEESVRKPSEILPTVNRLVPKHGSLEQITIVHSVNPLQMETYQRVGKLMKHLDTEQYYRITYNGLTKTDEKPQVKKTQQLTLQL